MFFQNKNRWWAWDPEFGEGIFSDEDVVLLFSPKVKKFDEQDVYCDSCGQCLEENSGDLDYFDCVQVALEHATPFSSRRLALSAWEGEVEHSRSSVTKT